MLNRLFAIVQLIAAIELRHISVVPIALNDRAAS
jgi:hypothetical protein